MLKYIVQTFDLPEEFMPDNLPAPPEQGLEAGQTNEGEVQEAALPPGGGQLAAQIRGAGQAMIDEDIKAQG